MKTISISTWSIWQSWESEEFVWKESKEFPKNLNGIKINTGFQIHPKTFFSLSLPFQINQSFPFERQERLFFETSNGYVVSDTFLLNEHPQQTSIGLGDFEISLFQRTNFFLAGFHLYIPTGYDPKNQSFRKNGTNDTLGFIDNTTWLGFGAYRIATSFTFAGGNHYLLLKPTFIVFSPGGSLAGLAEAGDFSIYSLYSKAASLPGPFKLKPMIQYQLSRFHWEGKDVESRIDMEITPAAALAYKTKFGEFSFLVSATAWGRTTNKEGKKPSPRKLTFGLNYYRGF